MVRKLLLVILSLIIVGFVPGTIFGGEKKSTTKSKINNSNVVATKYNTISECVESIRSDTGLSLKIITNSSNQVSGFLSNGQHFACVQKETETKDTYIDGWYTKGDAP